jgi:hypothetical protein
MAKRTFTPPAPVAPADQARFDAVTRCRARVETMKLEGAQPRAIELAVKELVAAVAAAPDMPPPPPPPVPEDEQEPDTTIEPEAAVDHAAPAPQQEM